jgi:hypothetical protein
MRRAGQLESGPSREGQVSVAISVLGGLSLIERRPGKEKDEPKVVSIDLQPMVSCLTREITRADIPSLLRLRCRISPSCKQISPCRQRYPSCSMPSEAERQI